MVSHGHTVEAGPAAMLSGCSVRPVPPPEATEKPLTLLDAFLLIGTGHGVLEAGGVGGVAGDGHIHPSWCMIATPGAHRRSRSSGRSARSPYRYRFADDGQFAGVVIKLRLNIGEAVDAGDDLGGVCPEAVRYARRGSLRALLALRTMPMAPSAAAKDSWPARKAKLGFIPQQPGAQVAVTQANLAIIPTNRGCRRTAGRCRWPRPLRRRTSRPS